MGEYYNWVNVDKKEFICPADFDFGNKRTESLVRGNEFLSALYDLLSGDWSGDHVFWMGDEKNISENSNNVILKTLYEHSVQMGYPGDAFDTVCESYKNVSGLYKATESKVRQEIGYYLEDIKHKDYDSINEYGIDIEKPYDGLFLRDGRNFMYVINHSRKVYYSFEETKILYQDNTESDYVNPLPLLLAYGRTADDGIWLGDVIGVDDEKPAGYKPLKSIQLDW